MSMLSRRIFINDGFKVVTLGLAMPHIFTQAVRAAELEAGREASVLNAPGSVDNRTLIVVQVAGGNDGLNTVVPYQGAGSDVYYAGRGTLAIKPEQALPINDRFALHPSLGDASTTGAFTGTGGLKALWDLGKLAIVQGVGYPNPSFSHFKAMDIWQTGTPDGSAEEGWLARLVKGAVDKRGHPFAGFAAANNTGGKLPPALMSPEVSVPAVDTVTRFQVLPDPRYAVDLPDRQNALVQLYNDSPRDGRFGPVLQNTEQTALDAVGRLQQAHAAYRPAVPYPNDGLGAGLKLLAETITGELGVKVGYVTIGGFDTHANQANQHVNLLRSLSNGLKALWDDLSAQGKADNVLIMTWSEFGRRVAGNGSNGTDHGTAGPQFVIGNGIKGGLWGAPSDLGNLQNGNLRYTTDFRSVYSTVMDGWLGVPAQKVLGQRYPTLGFLGAGAGR